jgi:uncharacterized FlaG/YvyC family protein
MLVSANDYSVSFDNNNGLKVAKEKQTLSTSDIELESNERFQKNNEDYIDNILNYLNKNVKNFQETLEFSYDNDKNRFNFVLKDTVTGDVIREYPTEDIKKLDKHVDNILGAVFDQVG